MITLNYRKPLYNQRVTIWVVICSEGIIGPFFFEDDAGSVVTSNGKRYRAMITDFLITVHAQLLVSTKQRLSSYSSTPIALLLFVPRVLNFEK